MSEELFHHLSTFKFLHKSASLGVQFICLSLIGTISSNVLISKSSSGIVFSMYQSLSLIPLFAAIVIILKFQNVKSPDLTTMAKVDSISKRLKGSEKVCATLVFNYYKRLSLILSLITMTIILTFAAHIIDKINVYQAILSLIPPFTLTLMSYSSMDKFIEREIPATQEMSSAS